MAKRGKTFSEVCESLIKRHNSLASRSRGRLDVYVASLRERFASMDYSLREVQRLIKVATHPTTEDYGPFKDYKQKRDFYANSFWSFSYSVFDILAHIVNTLHPAVTDESKVSFLPAGKGYKSLPSNARGKCEIPESLRTKLARIATHTYFKRLARYRQCCLHRRAVCSKEKVTEETVSSAYATSARPDERQVVTWIVDNPTVFLQRF